MAANPSELEVRFVYAPAETIIHCKGRITSSTAHLLKEHAQRLIETARSIALDLTDVTHMDSWGLGAIVGLYVSARRDFCEFRIINLNQHLKELFSLARLYDLLVGERPSDKRESG